MPDRTLSRRELNRAVLARQLLLERSDLSIPAALEQVAGLQTQYSPAGYVGLWSRLRDFRRESLTEALSRRKVVQATLMRSTIHMVSARDHRLFAAGSRRIRREWWLRVQKRQLEGIDTRAGAEQVRSMLADGPRRQAEILKLLEADGLGRLAFSSACAWLDLVRVPPSGTWRQRRADLYGLAEEWLGPSEVTEENGQEHLVRRYLGGFGPAASADIASWAGFPAGAVRPVLERMDLQTFRDEDGRELVDLPGAPLPEPDTPAPVRFLHTWEALLLVHARRGEVLSEEYRPRVFNTRTPHSVPTLLVDGQVAGTWRYDKDRIVTEPFRRLTPSVRREVEEEVHCERNPGFGGMHPEPGMPPAAPPPRSPRRARELPASRTGRWPAAPSRRPFADARCRRRIRPRGTWVHRWRRAF